MTDASQATLDETAHVARLARQWRMRASPYGACDGRSERDGVSTLAHACPRTGVTLATDKGYDGFDKAPRAVRREQTVVQNGQASNKLAYGSASTSLGSAP